MIDSSLRLSILFFRYAAILLSKRAPTFFYHKQIFYFTLYFQKVVHTSLTCFNKYQEN